MAARTVLIADDDPLTRLMVRTELEAAGYRIVDEAADGYAAIALSAAHEPDVVVLDQMMPLLDGSDAIAAILSVAPASRVVVYSAVDSEDLARHAFSQGAARFVDKAQPVAVLVEAVGETP